MFIGSDCSIQQRMFWTSWDIYKVSNEECILADPYSILDPEESVQNEDVNMGNIIM